MKKLLIVLLFLSLIINVNAQNLPNYQDKYVNDFAHIFNDSEIQQLRLELSETEKNTSTEVVIVTINTTSPLAPSEYRTRLFNFWHIGKKEKDNGLLILYSLQENRIEVETGYGLEGILPDSKLGRLLDEYYVPYRNQNQVTQGITLFTQEVTKIINENKEEVLVGNNQKSIPFIIILICILIIIIIVIYLSTRKTKCEKCGLSMKKIGKVAAGITAGYTLYRCAKGHTLKIDAPLFWQGRGFGGGGFGSGGFGGGASGGGGAGR